MGKNKKIKNKNTTTATTQKVTDLMGDMDIGKSDMFDTGNQLNLNSDSDDIPEENPTQKVTNKGNFTKTLAEAKDDQPKVARPTTKPTDKNRKYEKESYTFWKEKDPEKLNSF